MRRAAPLPNWVRISALIKSSDMLCVLLGLLCLVRRVRRLGAGDETCTALQTGTVHGEPRSGHVDHGGQSLAEATPSSSRPPARRLLSSPPVPCTCTGLPRPRLRALT